VPRRFLALRMLGDFTWPPVPGQAAVRTVQGAVEVFYLPDPVSGEYFACGRWTPKSGFFGGDEPTSTIWRASDEPYPEKDIYQLGGAGLTTLVGDGTRPFFFRFASRNTLRRGVKLRFAGGLLFEQFKVPRSNLLGSDKPAISSDLTLDLRLPLVRQVDGEDDGKIILSALEFGQPQNTGLGLDLALPVPLPLKMSGSAGGLADVLAFRGVSSGRNLILDKPSDLAGQAIPFENLYLGRKGSSASLDKPGPYRICDALFARAADPDDPYRTAGAASVWLGKSAVGEVLERIGLKAGPATLGALTFAADAGSFLVPASAGLWTGSDTSENKVPAFRLLRRHRLSVTGSPSKTGPHDDLRIVSGKIEIRRRKGHDDWVTVGAELNIFADYNGVVEHQDIWKHTHSLTLDVKLAWRDELVAALPSNGASWASALGGIRDRMKRAIESLNALEGAQPSALFAEMTSDNTRLIAFATGYRPRKVMAISAGEPAMRQMERPQTFQGTLLPADDVPATPGGVVPNDGRAARHPPILKLRFPHFERAAGKAATTFEASLLPDPEIAEKDAPDDILFSVAIRGGSKKASLCSIGGLGFDGVSLDAATPRSGSSYSRLRLREAAHPDDEPVMSFQAVFVMDLVLPLAIDRRRGDRRNTPMPTLLNELKEVNGRYRLVGMENLAPDEDRRLVATLSEFDETDARAGSFILLSESPFGLKRSIAEPLSSRGDAETVEVAQYDSDTRQWLTRTVTRAYRYILPPQSIGESMDKPRRLELHDEPAVPGITPSGVEKQVAVAFRLTPPAELWVRPSDVERRYTLPEWAASEIFRQRGELGLGAALAGLRAEFVYGLPVGIDPARESGPSRGARVAEIEALVGRPITYDNARWKTLLRAYDTRPERLEIWANDPDASMPFAPARFSAGARFALRRTALHRHPIADQPATPGELPEVDTGGPLRPRFHLNGLPGGALWPIESRNVLAMVTRSPIASSGSVERIALSPLGGDADQTARFANNRAAIISETRGGYVQRQKVEVIGRIAVLWHRAKHVIVYERTVNPSAQFAPLDQSGTGTRTRRPVLRKISEYIEILEAERRYPDMAAAAASSNAMLAAVRFNGRIIPVDSGWGEDVGDVGFTVPLWNRYAARERPQVYRRPDVAFVTHAEGAADQPEAAQECLNPENLYFFADTTDKATDDTDAWVPRVGIDTTQLPPPRHRWKNAMGTSPSNAAAAGSVLESEARVPLGFARFSWRLAPPTARTAINAGRADMPVYAALESLTFTRGVGQAGDELKAALAKAADYQPTVDLGAVFNGVWTKDGAPILGSEDAYLPDLAATLRDVSDNLPRELPADVGPLRTALQSLKAKVDSNGGPEFAAFKKSLVDAGGHADAQLGNLMGDPCKRLKDDFIAKFAARTLALRQELSAWEADLSRRLAVAGAAADKVLAQIGSPPDVRRFLTAELVRLARPALSGATNEVGRLQSSIETALATIAEVRADAEASIVLLKADLRAVRRSIEDAKPWSQSRVERFQEQLQTEFARGAKRLSATMRDAQRRLTTELDALAQKIAGAGGQGLAMVSTAAAELEQARDTFAGWRIQLAAFAKIYAAYTSLAERRLREARAVLERAQAKSEYAAFVAKAEPLLAAVEEVVGNGGARDFSVFVDRLARFELEIAVGAQGLGDKVAHFIRTAGTEAAEVLRELAKVVDESGDALKLELADLFGALGVEVGAELRNLVEPIARDIEKAWRWSDSVLATEIDAVDHFLTRLNGKIDETAGLMDEAAGSLLSLSRYAIEALEPDALAGTIVEALLGAAAVEEAIKRAEAAILGAGAAKDQQVALAASTVTMLADELERQLDEVGDAVWDLLPPVSALCGQISDQARIILDGATDLLAEKLVSLSDKIPIDLDEITTDIEKYKEFYSAFSKVEGELRSAGNEIAQSAHRLESWGDRAIDAITQIGKGGVSSAPNNVLKALAAIGSGPELPNLDFAAERIGYYYGLLDSAVDTTPVEAWFGKLGDGLKAMGISLPFRQIGERLIPDDLENLNVSRVFGGFAGLDLSRFFGAVKLPKGAKDAIKVTHDFDRKTFRAWVQVDIAVDLPGRNPMFSVGPFTLDTVNAKLSGFVRLEASKDTETVEQTGEAKLKTDLDAVVAGQSMVTLREIEIRYGKSGGLNVDFDPKKLKLNPSFQFIQNTLQSVFGDEFGGFEIVKNNGVPVGLRHIFAMPPLSLTFGTSGVQNIQISNQFELTAYPDFVIANRFALARPELPFIFTIFIIGGTGWLTVDVEYRPFEGRGKLMVVVEAAAGGAASLAFAFAGVTGSVFITVSVALSYRKLIGDAGGGLTVSLVVVITGLVDVLRIVSAMITVMLRLSYFENGDIDAVGSFRITIRISRFFKVSAGGQARYRMTGGKSQTTSSSSADYEVTDPNLQKAEKLLNKKKGS